MRSVLTNHLARTALCLFFAVCICLPLADLALGLDTSAALKENRVLASLPSLSAPIQAVGRTPTATSAWKKLARAIAAFPASFTQYYNDNFGWRRTLVRAHSQLMVLGWPAKGDVIVGRDGWLFLGQATARVRGWR